jgi:hypothetical protein
MMDAGRTRPPEWRLSTSGEEPEVLLSGDWVAREGGMPGRAAAARLVAEAGGAGRLSVCGRALGRWDSALIVFVGELRATAANGPHRMEVDIRSLPDGSVSVRASGSGRHEHARV